MVDYNPKGERDELDRGLTEDSETELSEEERIAALGRRMPRYLALGIGVIAVAVFALLLYHVGNKVAHPGRPLDTLATAQQSPVSPAVTPAAPEPMPASAPPETAAQLETPAEYTGAEVSPTDTGFHVTADSNLSPEERALINDQFYRLLNAQVSDTEGAGMRDSDFVRFLFTPLTPAPELPVPYRVPMPSGEGGVPGVAYAGVDSLRYLLQIDSLRGVLAAYHEMGAKPETLAVRGAGERVAPLADTLRQAEIRKLAKIIESMEPAAAATMLSARSNDDLRDIMFRLKPRVAAKIAEALPASKRDQFAQYIVRR